MKVIRLGTMNIFKDNIIYTNKYGRNPVDFEMNSIVIERPE